MTFSFLTAAGSIRAIKHNDHLKVRAAYDRLKAFSKNLPDEAAQ